MINLQVCRLCTAPGRIVALVCVVGAAVALPVRHVTAQPGGSNPARRISDTQKLAEAEIRNDELPPSFQEFVDVMVEMSEPPLAVAYEEAMKAAHAERETAREQASRDPRSSASETGVADQTPVQVSSAAATELQNRLQRLDQAQQALLPLIHGPDIGGTVLYRTQHSFNGIAVRVKREKIAHLAKLPGVRTVQRIIPAERMGSSERDAAVRSDAADRSRPEAGERHGDPCPPK